MRTYDRITQHFTDNIVYYGLTAILACFLTFGVNYMSRYSAQIKESVEQQDLYFSRLDSIGQARYQNLLENQVDSSLVAPRDFQ